MRKVGREAAQAFLARKPYKNGNTYVEVAGDIVTMRLHGHDIAYLYADGRVVVTMAGWGTMTTASRLNDLSRVMRTGFYFTRKNWEWFFCGVPYDPSDTVTLGFGGKA